MANYAQYKTYAPFSKKRECLGFFCQQKSKEKRFFNSVYIGNRICTDCKNKLAHFFQDVQEE